ncbi:MAG: hypothetical protein SFY68_09960 [Candidatus Sumerlaeia bacterium]|nr:hypothetical protein [Candidatus Sumerlaeia bacterium]
MPITPISSTCYSGPFLFAMLLLLSLFGCGHKNIVLQETSDSESRLIRYGDRASKAQDPKKTYQIQFPAFDLGFGSAFSPMESASPRPFAVVGGKAYIPKDSGSLHETTELQVVDAVLLPTLQHPYATYEIRPKQPMPLNRLLEPVLLNYRDLSFLIAEVDIYSESAEPQPALLMFYALRDEELLNKENRPLFRSEEIPGDSRVILVGVVCPLTDRVGLNLNQIRSLDLRLTGVSALNPELLVANGTLQLYSAKKLESR